MKVVFLTAGTSRTAGGLYFTITELTKALHRKGVDVTVVGCDDEYSAEDRAAYGNVPVRPYIVTNLPILKTFGYSYNLLDLLEEIEPDIIHVQGIWMYNSWAAKLYKNKHPNTKIVIEPHGMLDPWAVKNSAWKKKLVGHLYEYDNLNNADYIHALCKSEEDSIQNLGLKAPVAIIPNGINLPDINQVGQKPKEKSLLYIGRIHPKKGLIHLVEAIDAIVKNQPEVIKGWSIRIAGWDQNGYQKKLEELIIENGIDQYIQFVGPKFGNEKAIELTQASAFILPSYSEGLPMSILEAWSYGLPTLMTEYCNLPEGFVHNAALRMEPNKDSVKDTLISLFLMSENDLADMGRNAMALVSEQFTWDKIAEQTISLYNSLLS